MTQWILPRQELSGNRIPDVVEPITGASQAKKLARDSPLLITGQPAEAHGVQSVGLRWTSSLTIPLRLPSAPASRLSPAPRPVDLVTSATPPTPRLPHSIPPPLFHPSHPT